MPPPRRMRALPARNASGSLAPTLARWWSWAAEMSRSRQVIISTAACTMSSAARVIGRWPRHRHESRRARRRSGWPFHRLSTLDEHTWLPTTLFLGKGSFDVAARGDVLLGPVANVFLLPEGINNSFLLQDDLLDLRS